MRRPGVGFKLIVDIRTRRLVVAGKKKRELAMRGIGGVEMRGSCAADVAW
jgi:hypothetical protein